jgi:multidrug resistance efflux pump
MNSSFARAELVTSFHASNSELFSNSIEFANQRATMDRVIESGRKHFDLSQSTIESLQQQLESVKAQCQEQLRRTAETRIRESEVNVKGLALEVAAAREQIDCIGFRRYGGVYLPGLLLVVRLD